jgi:DNA invertase Pin-like site-specific DNA recombinase
MTQRRNGISYRRFSHPGQAKGDSEERQERDFRSFCQRHNLTPLREEYTDRGRSGYHDAHRKKGRLGQLIAAAKAGRFEPNSVIVIEAWDRLGRLRPDKQTDLIAELLKTGVDIGICRLDDIFTEDDFGTHKWTTLAVFVQLAYQESKQKADRLASSWERRRERARQTGKIMTGCIPAWLSVVNGVLVPIPERVAAVRRIFQLMADGFGQRRIITKLTAEGIKPLGKGKHWSHTYLGIILNDRRVLGELQPKKGDKADGPLLVDYYPRIIEDDLYLLAKAGREGRRGRRGQRDRKYVNIFQSLLVNALDGDGFFLANQGTHERPQLVLANAAGREGRAKISTFPYPIFEEAILGLLREVKPDDVLPRRADQPNTVEVLRARLANIRADIAGLQADLKEGYSKALAAVLRDREAQEEKVAGELQEELAKNVRSAERAWKELPSLVDLIREHGDEARLKIRGVLRSIVEDARLLLVRRRSYLLAACQFFFSGGEAVRSYLVVYQSPGRCRVGGLQCAISLAEVAGPEDLDLRRRDQAAKLESDLLKLDPEWLAEQVGGK